MASETQSWSGVRVYTIGHSTRSEEEFAGLLGAFGVTLVVDVRTLPRSRHNPQFEGAALATSLAARGLSYAHLPSLGGLRRPRKDSPNTAWRNASFRGYADYMQTEGFAAGLAELRTLAAAERAALLCAEAVPWRCHRSLVADALTVRGALVEHITGPARASAHRLTPFALVRGTRVTYPGEDVEARLETRAPFHLEATVRVLQRRPSNLVDVWEEGRYLRALETPAGLALAALENRGSITEPDLRLSVHHENGTLAAAAALPEIARTLERVLGLDLDPAPLERAAAAEPRLRAAARALRGMRPPRCAGWFETFANVVPFQQVSLDSGAAIVARLVERFGKPLEHGGRRSFAFPSAKAIARAPIRELRGAGLSAAKLAALRAAARAIEAGELDLDGLAALETPSALRELERLPGIGPWSAALVLLRGLGRLDVFPPGDSGVARGLGRLAGSKVSPERALARALERFGDQRGYLYFCMLGQSLLEKGLIRSAED